MESFGLAGLLLGPVIMAALLTVWREWIGVGDRSIKTSPLQRAMFRN
jgi:predicted PurR-regulated permease PerM